MALLRKLLWLTQRRGKEKELGEELEFHLSEEAEQGQADGLPADEARWAAQRSLGNVTLVREDARAAWGWIWFERFWQDLRYAARGLVKSPVFTAVAVFSLAIGIGATATIFSVFEAVFWHGVTARDMERLRHVEIGEARVSYRQYQELAGGAPMLAGLAAHEQTSLSFGSGSELEKVSGEVVSANFFSVLGVAPALGRAFAQGDNRTVILSHSFWERHFHGDTSVPGRVTELNGSPYTVIGVLPKAYRSIHGYGIAPEIYVPIGTQLAGSDETRLELIARLKDGATIAQAEAEVRATAQQWRDHAADKIQMYPLTGIAQMRRDGVPVELGIFFVFLLLVAGLVLLIACANVGGLLIARGVNRSREMAVRVALGAARYRLLQQVLTESLALALLGCGGGIVLQVLASRLMDRIQISTGVSAPLELHLAQDSRLLAFAIAAALAATLLSGLTPALRASQIQRDARQPFALRRWLVAGQFAFAFVLLVSAALFVRSLARSSQADPGFDVKHVITAEVNLGTQRYFERAMSEIRRLPGVRSVSGAAMVPLGIEHWVMSLKAGDRIIQRVHVNSVTPGYFDTMRIALLRGRDFLASDRSGAMPVAIVNETFARKYLNDHAIDDVVLIPHRPGSPGGAPVYSRVRVVGVVADSKYGSLGEDPAPALYWPYLQEYRPLVLQISVYNSPAGTLVAVRDALGHLDPSMPVRLQLMEERLAGALLPSRLASVLLATIGSLGMLLAAIGIYGMMAFSVSRRTAEIGVRLALGATRRDVLRLVLRDALGLTSIGMAAGFLMALLFTRPLAGLLPAGMSVTDPFSFGGVGAVLIVVALAAAALPAWRASCIDPMAALRYE